MSFRNHALDSLGRTLISPKMKIIFRCALVVMAASLILAGCSAASTGTSSSTPPSASTLNIQPIPAATWSSMATFFGAPPFSAPRYGAYYITDFGYLASAAIEAYIGVALAGWTDSTPASYSAGEYTITWSHSGNTWTWTITYTVSSVTHTIVITVTSTSSGWNLTVTDDGAQWLTGSVNSNGAQGTATLSDPSKSISGAVTVVWTSASSPYNYKYTITATGGFASLGVSGATTATVVLQTDSAGAHWTYTYSDTTGASDTWTV